MRAPSTRFGAACVVGLLTCLGLAVYWNSLDAPFYGDDGPSIAENPRIHRLWPFGNAGYDVLSTDCGRPVVRLSLAINYALGEIELGEGGVLSDAARALGIGRGGNDVRGYHVFNLALHILSSLVLFGIVRRTLRSKNLPSRFHADAPLLALITAAIWLVHPLQTDAVTYIIQRTELLMGLFYLLTLFTAIRALESRFPWAWCSASVLCCALGMGSKEAMASAPILIVLYDRAFAFPSWREALRRRRLFHAGLFSTWFVLAALVFTGPRHGTVGFDLGVAWWQYLATQAGVILHYLRLVFWPRGLCLDYGSTLAHTAREIVPGALVLGALALTTAWALWRRPALGFAGAWFFLILAPSSSVVPIVTEVGAERRMYLPLAAVVVLVVLGAHRLWRGALDRCGSARPGSLPVARFLPHLLAAAVVLALGAATVLRNQDYRDPVRQWRTVTERAPDNDRGHVNLASALLVSGRTDEAIRELEQALSLNPDRLEVYLNLGLAYEGRGDLDRAIDYYERATRRLASGIPHQHLGQALARKGSYAEAAPHLQRALELDPRNAPLHDLHGMVLGQLQRPEEARAQYEQALEIDPDLQDAHTNLAALLASQGKYEQALPHYQRALEIPPRRAEELFNLGQCLAALGRFDQALATLREAALGAPDLPEPCAAFARIVAARTEASPEERAEALGMAQKANRLAGSRRPDVLETLAILLAAQGDFAQAGARIEEALQLPGPQSNPVFAERLRDRLAQYRRATQR